MNKEYKILEEKIEVAGMSPAWVKQSIKDLSI